MRSIVRAAIALAVLASPAWTFAADLTGSVRDRAGRPRPGVEVTLKGTDRTTEPISRNTRTTNSGEFAFPNIPPGKYDLGCDGTPQSIRIGPGINRWDCQ
jgi:hypothetical protein